MPTFDNSTPPAERARATGGLVLLLVGLMEQALDDGDVNRADIFLAEIATTHSEADVMDDSELRAFVDGLFAQVLELRANRDTILGRRHAVGEFLAPSHR